MALSFSEKFRASLGGKEFRAYEITCDGTATTIEAAKLDMAFIDNCILTPKADLNATFEWDPGNLIDAAGETASVALTGAILGDYVMVNNPVDILDTILTAWAQSAAKVDVRIQNESAGTKNVATSAAWIVRVLRYCGLSTTRGKYVIFGPALVDGDVFTLWAIGQ